MEHVTRFEIFGYLLGEDDLDEKGWEKIKRQFNRIENEQKWVLDTDNQECYLYLPFNIQLSEGDRVKIVGCKDFMIVKWKCVYAMSKGLMIEYILKGE